MRILAPFWGVPSSPALIATTLKSASASGKQASVVVGPVAVQPSLKNIGSCTFMADLAPGEVAVQPSLKTASSTGIMAGTVGFPPAKVRRRRSPRGPRTVAPFWGIPSSEIIISAAQKTVGATGGAAAIVAPLIVQGAQKVISVDGKQATITAAGIGISATQKTVGTITFTVEVRRSLVRPSLVVVGTTTFAPNISPDIWTVQDDAVGVWEEQELIEDLVA